MARLARLAAAAPLLAFSLASGRARADAFTVFGFGPAGVGEANARAARADDGTATHSSPGGLALGNGYHAEVGTLAIASGLRAAGTKTSIEDPIGVTAALDADVPLEGLLEKRFRVGLGFYTMPTSFLHVLVRKEETPFFPYYDNRTQRLVVLPALAVRITSRLGIGACANVLGGVSGNVDLRLGATRTPEPKIDQSVVTVIAPIASIRFDPIDELHLSAVYRARFSVDVVQTTDAVIGGVPLHVDAVKRQALFDPATATIAAAWDFSPQTAIEIDGSYLKWASYTGPQFDVAATLPGVEAVSATQPRLYKDTWTVRAAGTTRLPLGEHDLVLRLGAGYEPSMMKTDRQGMTDLVDGDKIIGALGASVALRGVTPGTLRIGLGLQGHVVGKRSIDKVACTAYPCPPGTTFGQDANDPSAGITNPGYPSLTSSGVVLAGALGIGVDL